MAKGARLVSANDRTGVGNGSSEWQTPPDLFARLHRRYQFDYDAFASHDNALCDVYSTVEGTFQRTPGERLQATKDDGLRADWMDLRVFMNPPYGRDFIGKAVGKAMAERERAAIIVALLPANTDTRWFHQCVAPYADIHFLMRRVRFVNPETGEPGASPPGGSMVVVWRASLQPMSG